MLWSILLACTDPVQEYTIPTEEKSDWKKWQKQGQKGPPIGEAKGSPPQDGSLPNPENDANLPPPVNPGGEEPEKVNDLQTGEASCRPIASSEPLAPRSDGVRITGTIERRSDQNGPLLLELVQFGEESTSLYSVACGSGGAFDFLVPNDLGEGYLVAFIDIDGNGPSESDDKGISGRVTVIDEAIVIGQMELDNSIEPLSLPFVMQAPSIEDEPVEQTGELPTNTDDLPPPQTGEGGQSEVDEEDDEEVEELPPPVNDGSLPEPVEEGD